MGEPLGQALEQVTERIIRGAFAVANELGHGFLEVIYKRALIEELRSGNILVEFERPYTIHYRGIAIGRYIADIVVEEPVLVELKAVTALNTPHVLQVRNYLKASHLKVGLLLNFGTPSVEIRRVLADRSPQSSKISQIPS
jgi:GxxExxY protein